jgi:hypothetical protein
MTLDLCHLILNLMHVIYSSFQIILQRIESFWDTKNFHHNDRQYAFNPDPDFEENRYVNMCCC